MDLDDGNIKDILRISYMLASALKREDAEGFLAVYDSIIPRGFSNKQVNVMFERVCERIEQVHEHQHGRLVFVPVGFELEFCLV